MATRVKRLLAVSWAMPPMLFPRSIQVSRLLGTLKEYGWEITVICSDPEQSGNLDTSLTGPYANRYETICVPAGNCKTPDDALMSNWLEPALKAVRKQLRRRDYTVLATFAQPWVDHLIGLKVRPANMPWIAHFSDPWVDSPYYADVSEERLDGWRNMERKVVRLADMILFTNPQVVDLVMNKYPQEWKVKARVIPHAFDPDLLETPQAQKARDTRLHMIFTGDLYKGRSAKGFLEALHFLSQKRPLATELEVQLIGHIAAEELQMAEALGLGEVVQFHKQLPYMESLKKSAECDVLLLIDAATSIPSPFLPSKLVDYLTFKKPIFGLTTPDGASADLLRRLGFSVISPNDIPAIANALSTLLNSWNEGSFAVSTQFEKVTAEYKTHKVGSLFNQLLSEAVTGRSSRRWWQIWS
jgi:glycosyltransferase involved in cell wall biosynthesis